MNLVTQKMNAHFRKREICINTLILSLLIKMSYLRRGQKCQSHDVRIHLELKYLCTFCFPEVSMHCFCCVVSVKQKNKLQHKSDLQKTV